MEEDHGFRGTGWSQKDLLEDLAFEPGLRGYVYHLDGQEERSAPSRVLCEQRPGLHSVHGVHCTRTPLGNRDGAGGQLHMLTSLALSGLQLMRLFLLICSEGPSEPSA